MLKLLLVSIFIISFTSIRGQEVSFYKENITMKMNENTFYVSGIYYLKSITTDKKAILYPFPNDKMYGLVDSIYIFNITANEMIDPIEIKADHLIFYADFSQYKNLEIQISYRQKLHATRAEYILETTLSWKKPFKQANYQLIIPLNMKVTRFSIQPQDSMLTEKDYIYYWEERNYMPDKNFIFDFEMK